MEARALEAEGRIDLSSNRDEALASAIRAIELNVRATKGAPNEQERKRLKTKTRELLDRAEQIKSSKTWRKDGRLKDISAQPTISLQAPISERVLPTKEEVMLLESSKLNGSIFPPWSAAPPRSSFEVSSTGEKFIDDFEFELSAYQRSIFVGWRRPEELFGDRQHSIGYDLSHGEPSMIHSRKLDLVQDVTTDCSVVASLCVEAARDTKGHPRAISRVMYPHDESQDRPLISASASKSAGKTLYVVDRENPSLLWPALLEKAYLKVRGGYDFPGSNSGTDLWILSGWIPEQIMLHRSFEIAADTLWTRMKKAFSFGDVMITLGTGPLSRTEEDEMGLAGLHDYAVLDLVEVDEQQLLLVKNPWCDGTLWKGALPGKAATPKPSSESPPEFLQTTAKLPEAEMGCFWISFSQVIQNFDSLYLNWNPGLFRHRQDHHFAWKLPDFTTDNSFIYCPQFSMKSVKGGYVWLLLDRHLNTGEQKLSSKLSKLESYKASPLGYISIYVFGSGGQRVYLTDDFMHRGPFVDSLQTLARLDLDSESLCTVVVAQQGLPLPKYTFTLSAYSSNPIIIGPASDAYGHHVSQRGSWTTQTAGGNMSSPSFYLNPQFCLEIPQKTDLMLYLVTDREDVAVHVTALWSRGKRVANVSNRDVLGASGEYKRGCATADLKDVAPGSYTIVCSTFEPGQLANFHFNVKSTMACGVKVIPVEGAGSHRNRLAPLSFHPGIDKMLAPVTIPRLTKIEAATRQAQSFTSGTIAISPLKLSFEYGQGPNKTILGVSEDGTFSDAGSGVRTGELHISSEMSQVGNVWLVVERLPGINKFEVVDVEILSESPVEVGPWGTGDG